MSCSVVVSKITATSTLFSPCWDSNSRPSAALKRKRPGMLDIPVVSPASFGSMVNGMSSENDVIDEERDGFYSVYCKRGRRVCMEDRFCARVDNNANSNLAFFGVFDGHGGVKAAEYAAKNIDKNIIAEIVDKSDEENLKQAVKNGYIKTDSEFLKQDLSGGSCCVTALITDGNLVVSNAGDCRAVICRGGVAEALTVDHRPSRQDERDRIEAKGGYIDCYNSVWRIQGSLAVSRAIGNKQLKQWIIAEPDTEIVRIKPDHEFLILASDGLWDKVTNQEAVDIARPIFTDSKKSQTIDACKKLVDLSISRGSLDDVSVVIIQLKRYML